MIRNSAIQKDLCNNWVNMSSLSLWQNWLKAMVCAISRSKNIKAIVFAHVLQLLTSKWHCNATCFTLKHNCCALVWYNTIVVQLFWYKTIVVQLLIKLIITLSWLTNRKEWYFIFFSSHGVWSTFSDCLSEIILIILIKEKAYLPTTNSFLWPRLCCW